MISVQTLYSGSSGNCTIIRDNETIILIDMGKSCRQTLQILSKIGIRVHDISAIFVTHEHSDHVSGLFTFQKYYKKPLFASTGTIRYLIEHNLIPKSEAIEIEPENAITVGNTRVMGFRTSHDSIDCYGYKITLSNGKSVAIATDLGYITDEMIAMLTGCSFLGIEANYDKGMLRDGSYPLYLKLRIGSPFGHLSNDSCSEAIVKLAKTGTDKFLLMHLSEENNDRDIAETNVLTMLENYGIENCSVFVAPRNEPSVLVEI